MAASRVNFQNIEVVMLKFFLNSMEYQESVQQFHFASRFAFRHFNLQIGAQMRTVIPHLKPILNTSRLRLGHFSESSAVALNCHTETQIQMRDVTVLHFPGSMKTVTRESEVGGSGGLLGLSRLTSSTAWFRVRHGPTSEPSTLLSEVPSHESDP